MLTSNCIFLKQKGFFLKTDIKPILRASSKENYYITQSIHDNIKIIPIENNNNYKKDKKKAKKEKKNKKDIEFNINWTLIKLYEINKNEVDIEKNVSIFIDNYNNIPSFRFSEDKIESENFIFKLKTIN